MEEPATGQLSYQEKKEFKRLENEIKKLETKKAEIEALFSTNEIPPEDIEAESVKLQEIIDELEIKEDRWLELSMKLEE